MCWRRSRRAQRDASSPDSRSSSAGVCSTPVSASGRCAGARCGSPSRSEEIVPNKTICYGPNWCSRTRRRTDDPDRRTDRPLALACALVVLCAGMLMIILDQTIVNVALPSIQSDLGFSQSSLAWVVNAYLIAFGGLLLLAGRLGDLIGRKRIFLAGLAVFTLASLLCGARQSQAMLIGARFVQGVGGALASAVILGMIVTMFPEPREQAQGDRRLQLRRRRPAPRSACSPAGSSPRRSTGTGSSSSTSPIGVAAAVLALRLLEPDARARPRRRRRRRGRRARHGRADARRLRDRRHCRPRLGLGAHPRARRGGGRAARGLRRPPGHARAGRSCRCGSSARATSRARTSCRRSWSPACSGCSSSARSTCSGVLGYDALQIGLAFLPVAIGIGVLSLGFSARLITRFGARAVLLPGLVLDRRRAGAVDARAGRGDYVTDMLPSMLLFGAGARHRVPGAR